MGAGLPLGTDTCMARRVPGRCSAGRDVDTGTMHRGHDRHGGEHPGEGGHLHGWAGPEHVLNGARR